MVIKPAGMASNWKACISSEALLRSGASQGTCVLLARHGIDILDITINMLPENPNIAFDRLWAASALTEQAVMRLLYVSRMTRIMVLPSI